MEDEISNPEALRDYEVQSIRNLISINIGKSMENINIASAIIEEAAINYSEELVYHRNFELHLRNGTCTEEILQQHLDSLVALRLRLQQMTKQKFAGIINSNSSTSTNSNTTGNTPNV